MLISRSTQKLTVIVAISILTAHNTTTTLGMEEGILMRGSLLASGTVEVEVEEDMMEVAQPKGRGWMRDTTIEVELEPP